MVRISLLFLSHSMKPDVHSSLLTLSRTAINAPESTSSFVTSASPLFKALHHIKCLFKALPSLDLPCSLLKPSCDMIPQNLSSGLHVCDNVEQYIQIRGRKVPWSFRPSCYVFFYYWSYYLWQRIKSMTCLWPHLGPKKYGQFWKKWLLKTTHYLLKFIS